MGQPLFLHSTFFLVIISDLESLQLLVFLLRDVCIKSDCQIFWFLFLISHYSVCLVYLYLFICLALEVPQELFSALSIDLHIWTAEGSANISWRWRCILPLGCFSHAFPICILHPARKCWITSGASFSSLYFFPCYDTPWFDWSSLVCLFCLNP